MKVTLWDKWNQEEVKVCRLKEGYQTRKLGVRLFRNADSGVGCTALTDDGKYGVYLVPTLPCGTWRIHVTRLDD